MVIKVTMHLYLFCRLAVGVKKLLEIVEVAIQVTCVCWEGKLEVLVSIYYVLEKLDAILLAHC